MMFEIDKTNADIIRTLFPGIEEEKIDDIVDVYGMSRGRVTFDTEFWESEYTGKIVE